MMAVSYTYVAVLEFLCSIHIFVLRIYIIYLTNKKTFNILATFIGKY